MGKRYTHISELYQQVKLNEQKLLTERELTPQELKRREEIAKKLPMDDFEKRYGKDAMSVKMATATKMAKKEELDKQDTPVVKKVVQMLKKASQAHAGQAKDLEKAVKEETELDENEGLKNKAEKSGMPLGVLKKVYNRGMAAWRTGHRPGTTPQQWGMARVNSFVTKSSGTWGGADKDLAGQVRGSKKEEVELDEGYEANVMKILKRKGLEGAAYFKNNNLMVSKRDFDAVKKALRFDKIPMTPPKIVVEEVELDESTGKYSKMNLDKAKKLMGTSKNREQGVKMVMKGLGTTYKHANQLVDKILGVNPKTGKIESAELDEKYDLYHSTFSGAMQHAYDHAKKKMGITVDKKEIDSKVATGPKKPSEGKTNKYRLKGKGGNLQIQVFNKGGSKPFELNMYKEEVELDEATRNRAYNFMVLDPDGKVMGMSSDEKRADDMAKPTGNLLKLRGRVVKLRKPMATTRGDRLIGMLPADNLGEESDPIAKLIDSKLFSPTEIEKFMEANYRVTYSTKGKLYSKKIRAKSEDEAEDIFVKQFKDKKIPIDADDIRSVVKEGETQ